MIDLDSAAAIARAAQYAHDTIANQISASPESPLVAELQRLADMAEELIKDNARTIAILERRTR